MNREEFLIRLARVSEELLCLAEKLDRKLISEFSKAECELLEGARKNVYRTQMILDLAVLAWYEREEERR